MPDVEEPGRPHITPEENSAHGRLSIRRGEVVAPGRTGLLTIDAPDGDLLGLAFVPELDGRDAYRLVVLLHGAGGSARQGLGLLLPAARSHGLLLVAPQSAAATWDLIAAGLGTDVRRMDRLLTEVLAGYPVGPMSIGGFSDGASYALSIGLTNGDVFDAIVAFAPGFAAPLVTHGTPRVFVTHGVADRVLPIDRCSRRLVPRLRAQGYPVTYEEFAGGHEVPESVAARAVAWLEEN